MAERNYRIAVIGGDGIGPEVVQAGQEALTALALEDGGFALSFTAYDWGSNYYRQHGLMMPADALSQLEGYDAIISVRLSRGRLLVRLKRRRTCETNGYVTARMLLAASIPSWQSQQLLPPNLL